MTIQEYMEFLRKNPNFNDPNRTTRDRVGDFVGGIKNIFGNEDNQPQPIVQQEPQQTFNYGSSTDYMKVANGQDMNNMGGQGMNPQKAGNIVGGIQQVSQAVTGIIDDIGEVKRDFLMGAPVFANAMLTEQHNERERSPIMAYNQDAYGTRFNNMFQDGGSVSRAKNILLGNQVDNTRVSQVVPMDPIVSPQPRYATYNPQTYQSEPWIGGTQQDTTNYNNSFLEGLNGGVQSNNPGFIEGDQLRKTLKKENGGEVSYSMGDELELTEEEIKALIAQGYEFN